MLHHAIIKSRLPFNKSSALSKLKILPCLCTYQHLGLHTSVACGLMCLRIIKSVCYDKCKTRFKWLQFVFFIIYSDLLDTVPPWNWFLSASFIRLHIYILHIYIQLPSMWKYTIKYDIVNRRECFKLTTLYFFLCIFTIYTYYT